MNFVVYFQSMFILHMQFINNLFVCAFFKYLCLKTFYIDIFPFQLSWTPCHQTIQLTTSPLCCWSCALLVNLALSTEDFSVRSIVLFATTVYVVILSDIQQKSTLVIHSTTWHLCSPVSFFLIILSSTLAQIYAYVSKIII